MCGEKSGLPIYEVTLIGEKADVSSIINFLDEINSWFILKDSKILADKCFDFKINKSPNCSIFFFSNQY